MATVKLVKQPVPGFLYPVGKIFYDAVRVDEPREFSLNTTPLPVYEIPLPAAVGTYTLTIAAEFLEEVSVAAPTDPEVAARLNNDQKVLGYAWSSPADLSEEEVRRTRFYKLTDAQYRLTMMEREKPEIDAWYEKYKQAIEEVHAEIGTNQYFQDEDGVVYKTVRPKGHYVEYRFFGIVRTAKDGEKKGSLSLAEAREAGFTPYARPRIVEKPEEVNDGGE